MMTRCVQQAELQPHAAVHHHPRPHRCGVVLYVAIRSWPSIGAALLTFMFVPHQEARGKWEEAEAEARLDSDISQEAKMQHSPGLA
jgi:hypothetical protein